MKNLHFLMLVVIKGNQIQMYESISVIVVVPTARGISGRIKRGFWEFLLYIYCCTIINTIYYLNICSRGSDWILNSAAVDILL